MKTTIKLENLTPNAKRQVLKSELSAVGGRFFTVKFTKKDGTERVMTARLGVKKDLKGGVSTTAHIDNLVTVWDSRLKQYRNINLDTVHFIHANKHSIEFN